MFGMLLGPRANQLMSISHVGARTRQLKQEVSRGLLSRVCILQEGCRECVQDEEHRFFHDTIENSPVYYVPRDHKLDHVVFMATLALVGSTLLPQFKTASR